MQLAKQQVFRTGRILAPTDDGRNVRKWLEIEFTATIRDEGWPRSIALTLTKRPSTPPPVMACRGPEFVEPADGQAYGWLSPSFSGLERETRRGGAFSLYWDSNAFALSLDQG